MTLKNKPAFTPVERQILKIVQDDLPDSATPFADIAATVGTSEQQVVDLIRSMKDLGTIRRFGATLRHQQAGYGFNAMVAWYAEEDHDLDSVGRAMAARPEISHCYLRRNCYDWPYNLYTMIHGRNRSDCQRVVQELQQETGLRQYEILFSDQELKKTSMRYF